MIEAREDMLHAEPQEAQRGPLGIALARHAEGLRPLRRDALRDRALLFEGDLREQGMPRREQLEKPRAHLELLDLPGAAEAALEEHPVGGLELGLARRGGAALTARAQAQLAEDGGGQRRAQELEVAGRDLPVAVGVELQEGEQVGGGKAQADLDLRASNAQIRKAEALRVRLRAPGGEQRGEGEEQERARRRARH